MNVKSALLFGAIAIGASSFASAQTPATTSAAEDSCIMLNTMTGQASSAKKAERAANRALARRIRQQLSQTQGLQNSNIVVFAMAQTGQVILAGIIQDESQDQIAADAAKKVQGVSSVSSKLTIREEGS
jgi:osmotically-inducible protein OsmY